MSRHLSEATSSILGHRWSQWIKGLGSGAVLRKTLDKERAEFTAPWRREFATTLLEAI